MELVSSSPWNELRIKPQPCAPTRKTDRDVAGVFQQCPFSFNILVFGTSRARFLGRETQMALQIGRHEQDGVSILELKGRLTFGPGDLILNDELRHALAARRVRLVIDLAGVDKIDSAGLGTLLYARAELRRAGGGLALANLRPSHMQVLLVAKLETVFNVFGSGQDAVNSFFPDRDVPRYDLLELVRPSRESRGLQELKRAS
jgi:anti-sigma B factor antagonist